MSFPFFAESSSMISIYLAVLMDIFLGDGNYPYHPVRLMGAAVSFMEKRARSWPIHPKFSGAIMVILLVTGIFFLCQLFLSLVGEYFFVHVFLSSVVLYFCICLRCLGDEAGRIVKLIEHGRMDEARRQLSYLVSRDTKGMSESDMCRSLIETVAENLVDGIFSPFFYGVVFGPCFAASFKMASTLDSMIGYRDSNYRDIGYFAAKLDDVLNFIPARLGSVFIILAGLLFHGRNPVVAMKKTLCYSELTESPNSGYPEAAFATVLGVRLGGPTSYDGMLKLLPYLNDKGHVPSLNHVRKAILLMYQSAFLFYLCPIVLFFYLLSGHMQYNF